MSSDRVAEALIIASTAGLDFLTEIQDQYLKKQNQRELSHLIMALVSQDWITFIKNCTLDSWKEALVAVLKHSQRKAVVICEKLGDRLLNLDNNTEQTLENTRNAIICFVCAGSIDKLILAWYQLKRLEHNNPKYQLNTDELQELAEILMLMNKSLETQGVVLDLDEKIAGFIKEYSGLLVAQGAFTAALAYIMAIKTSNVHPDLNDLQQRISNIIQPTGAKAYHQQQLPQQHHSQAFGGLHQQRRPSARTGSFSYAPPTQSSGAVSTPVPCQTPSMMYGSGGAPPSASSLQAGALSSSYQPPIPAMGWSQHNTPAASPASVTPSPMIVAPTPPLMANKTAHIQQSTNENIYQQQPPPRPLSSTGNLNDGGSVVPPTSRAVNLHSRSKYVLDPSVAPVASGMNANVGSVGSFSLNAYNNNAYPSTQTQSNLLPGATNTYNPTMAYGNNSSQQQPAMMMAAPVSGLANASNAPGNFKTAQFGGASGNYLPGIMPIETNVNNNAPICTPPTAHLHTGTENSVQKNPTPPPGWNDPPALKSTRQVNLLFEVTHFIGIAFNYLLSKFIFIEQK